MFSKYSHDCEMTKQSKTHDTTRLRMFFPEKNWLGWDLTQRHSLGGCGCGRGRGRATASRPYMPTTLQYSV